MEGAVRRLASGLTFQEPQQFGARNQELSTKRATGAEFSALDETIDAKIIDSQKSRRFMNGIGEPRLLQIGVLFLRASSRRFHECSYWQD